MANSQHVTAGETLEGSHHTHQPISSESIPGSKSTQDDDVAEADAVTPLASERASLSGGASEPGEESVGESFPAVQTTEVANSSATTPTKPTTAPAIPTTAAASTHISHENAVHSYFPIHQLHSQPTKRTLRHNGSGQSSGSLTTLAETEGPEESPLLSNVKRSSSTRTRSSSGYIRKHHSKSLSMSQPVTNLAKSQQTNNGHPGYPEQSLASLSPPLHAPHPIRPIPLRAKSSHPADMASPNSPHGHKHNVPRFAHTTDNTPIGSPGLFSPAAVRNVNPLDNSQQRSGSPSLHHLQTPKETHAAEIDVDTISGNKLINTYEVMKELGRGEHGSTLR